MDAWWTGAQAAWLGGVGGSVLGILGGTLGTLSGVCAPRGKFKTLVLSLFGILLCLGVVSLVAGIVALIVGQPYHVFYPLLGLGGITTVVLGSLLPVVLARYREAEMRHLDAESLRRS